MPEPHPPGKAVSTPSDTAFRIGFPAHCGGADPIAARQAPELPSGCNGTLFATHPHPMWIHDLESLAFLDVNEAAVAAYGYARDEFLAMTVLHISLPEAGAAVRTAMAELHGAAHAQPAVCRHRRKDGAIIAVELTSNALDYHGRPARLNLAIDITAGLRMQEALLRAEAKYRGIFENALEGIFQTSPQGHYLDANPALARIYGYESATELVGGLTDIANQLYVDPSRRSEFTRLMREHEAVTGFESQVRRRDGRVIWISESSRAVRDAAGRLLYYEGIVEDITHRRHAEEEIRGLNVELQRRLERVAALRRIDETINQGRDLPLTLDVCLQQVIGQLRPDAAAILLCEPGARCFRPAASHGFRTEALRETALPLDHGVAGRAVRERRMAHIAELAGALDGLAHSPELAGEEFVSCYAVPLVAKDEVKGVLAVFHRAMLDPGAEWVEFLEILAGQTAIVIDNAWLLENLRRSNNELAAAYEATIEGLSRALDLRDQETEGHSRRVTEMTLRLATAMGIPDTELIHVRRGALLHDIGKMGIPDRILHKPGPLSEDEWRLMRRHPQYAKEMLQPIDFLRSALEIPFAHHERWDGTGYPCGLKGEEIPLPARIFAVVDVWDALRSDRPYRPAWSEPRVREHLRSLADTHFDPAVVEIFLRTFDPGFASPDGHAARAAEVALAHPDEQAGDPPTRSGSLGEGLLFDTLRAGPQQTGMTITVAEDHEPSAQELTRILESLGHKVHLATNDDAAWRVVQEAGARLVITDWTTNGIDGPRLCRRIRSQQATHPYTYIIVLTARGASADRLECLHAGADDYLTMPTDSRELAARLEIARRILGMQEELERKNTRLAELVTLDALTGLKNRRHFREELDAAFSLAMRNDQPLSVVMLDVDDFKRYNDTFGHLAGDEILVAMAELLRGTSREHDVVARYGGEEFALLLPATDVTGSLDFAERLRRSIETHRWCGVQVTASLGIATSSRESPNGLTLVEEADQALYQSKRRGRNRVTHHEELIHGLPAQLVSVDYAAYPFQD